MMSAKRKLDTVAGCATITSYFQTKPKVHKSLSTESASAASSIRHVKGNDDNVDVKVVARSLFDKEKWIDSLTPDQKDLLELEISTLEESWLAALHEEFTKPYFLSLKQFLKKEKANGKKIFPAENDIYSWSRLTPLKDVRIIILGQDPYHNDNQAHGLAFSVQPPTRPPPSLQNIYKALKIDYPEFKIPTTGLLTPWSKQGVLLLNACLTVQAHNANSHSNKGWETFTERVLQEAVKGRPNGICFLAWGTPAQKRVDKISPPKTHSVLRSVHPSPLSASRGFFQGHHFRKANSWLQETYGPEAVINWAIDPSNVINEIADIKKGDKKESDQNPL